MTQFKPRFHICCWLLQSCSGHFWRILCFLVTNRLFPCFGCFPADTKAPSWSLWADVNKQVITPNSSQLLQQWTHPWSLTAFQLFSLRFTPVLPQSFCASSVLATGHLTTCQLTAQALTESDICTDLNYLWWQSSWKLVPPYQAKENVT